MRHPSLGWRILFSGFNHLNTKMTAIRTHIIIEFMRADKNTGERHLADSQAWLELLQ
jgi:predicted deacetylase